MQEHAPAIPSWILQVLRDLALFVGGGGCVRLLILWLNRKKPVVEVKKTEAETTEITIRSHATAGDSLGRMMDRLDRSVAQNERLRNERDDLQEKCDKLEMEAESHDRQMDRMRAWLKMNGLTYPDAGDLRPQLKKSNGKD